MNEQQTEGVILIVDDSPITLGGLIYFLNRKHFETVVEVNGYEALERIHEIQPDIILLDVMMPDMDGFEACRRLKAREDTKDIPIIFITAMSDVKSKIKGFKQGGVDYITKPFNLEEVYARVTTHLTLKRLRRQLLEQNRLLQDKNQQMERLNQVLEAKNKELQELNASKDKFFSIIAHDLRGPFSAFFTALGAINSSDEFKTVHHITTYLEDSAENLYKFMENLLQWARVHMNSVEFHPEKVQCDAIIQECIDPLHTLFEQKEITITYTPNPDLWVYVDVGMISTVLRNLLMNALKFTPRGGAVQVYTQDNGDMVQLAVQDNGIGIAENALAKLFKIDEKYRSEGTEEELGSGLGLILSKEFIEKHGGRIWATSEVNQGSTFYTTLPKYMES
ncbi:MAG: hybrid sensor histidine kinase/response regulator [Gemmatimonadetes bacterium]|nr:MAG: hybrid sensor histidine kinase/response regulator [Gemmatimonadota bacterium]